MAGPSVMVNILGDASRMAQSFEKIGSTAEGVASRAHGAFSGFLGVINKTGILGPFGEALNGIDEAIGKVIEHGGAIGTTMIGVGGALAGVGVSLTALGSKDKAAHQQLQAAVEATGKSYDDYADQVEGAIKKQEKYGHTADDTQDALRLLTQATGDPAKALNLIATASDLAASKHESLSSAAGQLGKAYNGSTKILKEFGLEAAPKAAAATKALDTATRGASTADEAAAAAKQRLSDLQARLGVSNKAAEVSTAGVTAAQEALAKAQQHAADVVALQAQKQAAGTKLTLSDQIALRDANQAVAGAQEKLTTATAAHTEAQAKANDKAGLTVSQQQQLRNAQQAVTDATGKATDAHKKMTDAQQAASKAATGQDDNMTRLSQKLSGQASAAADTFGGKVAAIKAHFEDQAATLGTKYGPALTGAGAAMAGLGAVIETTTAITKAFTGGTEAAATATKAMSAAEDTAAVSEGLALGPILLIIVAIAALAAAAYLIYRNWDTIWSAMHTAVKVVWDWISKNWPLLLAIILGPIAIAALEIARHWDAIKGGAASAVNWIKDQWNGLVGFFTGLPGRIAGAARGMWDGVWQAFREAINHIINGWNGLRFGIPEIDTHIPGVGKVGGGDFGVPQIPRLAQGGLITATGLIYAHAGEAITPAPGRQGPAVNVEHAYFSNDMDVESFMRKAAWVARTAGV
jgi:hypothetical protein